MHLLSFVPTADYADLLGELNHTVNTSHGGDLRPRISELLAEAERASPVLAPLTIRTGAVRGGEVTCFDVANELGGVVGRLAVKFIGVRFP